MAKQVGKMIRYFVSETELRDYSLHCDISVVTYEDYKRVCQMLYKLKRQYDGLMLKCKKEKEHPNG